VSTIPQYIIGIPSQSSKAVERKKRDSNREGKYIPICRCYDLISKRHLKLHQKPLRPILNTFSKVAGYKNQ
jgi:hypothetical protein